MRSLEPQCVRRTEIGPWKHLAESSGEGNVVMGTDVFGMHGFQGHLDSLPGQPYDR